MELGILGAYDLWAGTVILAVEEAPVKGRALPLPALKRVKIPFSCQPDPAVGNNHFSQAPYP